MTEERVVVDGELRVERAHLAFGRDDERVDLAEHRLRRDERLVELLDDRGDLLLLARILDAAVVHEPARVPRMAALERVDVEPHERVRARRGDLLDVHPALRREHEERLLRAAVEREREVVLALDVRGPLDPQLRDDVAADVHAEDLSGARFGLVRRARELDAAGLPTAAGEHLRLHDHRVAELVRRGSRLGRIEGETALRHRDPVLPEELLPLVLVEVQSARESTASTRAGRPRSVRASPR